MRRRYDFYLQDILDALERVQRYTAGLSETEFSTDEKSIAACTRELEIVGEAVAQLPDAVKKQHPCLRDHRPSSPAGGEGR